MKIQKRDGRVVPYEEEKIREAIHKANNEVEERYRASEGLIEEILEDVQQDLREICSEKTAAQTKATALLREEVPLPAAMDARASWPKPCMASPCALRKGPSWVLMLCIRAWWSKLLMARPLLRCAGQLRFPSSCAGRRRGTRLPCRA